MFRTSFLFASLIWGSIGVGFLVYGKKQRSLAPTVGGILMIVASYFSTSALAMSVICLILVLIICFLARQGY